MTNRISPAHVRSKNRRHTAFPLRPLVISERYIAVAAVQCMPAAWAVNKMAVAPPIQQQNRLFPTGEHFPQRLLHRRTDQLRLFCPTALKRRQHVDDLHLRQRQIMHPMLHHNPAVGTSPHTVMQRFQRRRCRPQQADRPGQLSPLNRRIPSMITRHHILFVAGLMLFIDNNQPQPAHRCKNRRARTNHHIGLPLPNGVPLSVPLRP